VNNPTIENALAPLVGLSLQCIGRAADLVWVHFGELRKIHDQHAGSRTVGEWALHLQCAWRLTLPPAIIIGREDLHYAAEGIEPYDWDTDGEHESRFDRIATSLNQDFATSPSRVSTVLADALGGFTLRLDGGSCFDVFPAISTASKSEHWRIFRPGAGGHLVFPTHA
jgi:hypothetical protein